MTNGQRENTYDKAPAERRKKASKPKLDTDLDEQALALIASAEAVQSAGTNTSVRFKPVLKNAIFLAANSRGLGPAEYINRVLLEATATQLMRPNRVGFFNPDEEPRPALEFALRCWAADERRAMLRIVDTLGEHYLPEAKHLIGDALGYLMKRLRQRLPDLPAQDVHDMVLPYWQEIEEVVDAAGPRRLDYELLIRLSKKIEAGRISNTGARGDRGDRGAL